MLRAKKIMSYVAEHLSPPYMTSNHLPAVAEGEEPPKPEDWLELLCHDQVFSPVLTCWAVLMRLKGRPTYYVAGHHENICVEDKRGCDALL
jgi:hypothetical protein